MWNRYLTSILVFSTYSSFLSSKELKSKDLFLLRIYHQNDIHSHFGSVYESTQVCPKTSRSSKKCVGGFARAVWFIKEQRKKGKKNGEDAIYLNAGDFFGGHIYYSLFGSAMASEIVPLMDYTAVAMGHTELLKGLDHQLFTFMEKVNGKRRNADAVFVCTNIESAKQKESAEFKYFRKLCPKHIARYVKPQASNKPERRVCILGFTSQKTAQMAHFKKIRFRDEIAALNEEVKYMEWKYTNNGKESTAKCKADAESRRFCKCEIIVAVGHSGLSRDLEIARKVRNLNILVGGHSHTLMADGQWQPFEPLPPKGSTDRPNSLYPTEVTQETGRKVIVMHGYRHGKYMGFMDVGIDDDNEVHDFWPDLRLLDDRYEEDADVMHILHKYDAKIEEELPKVVGHSLAVLDGTPEKCDIGECNMANLLADAALRASKNQEEYGHPAVHIALVTSEILAMPEPQPAGSLTLEFLTKALPYGHTFSVVHVPGHALRKAVKLSDTNAALKRSSSSRKRSSGQVLHFSGMKVTINKARKKKSRVQSVFVDLPCEVCGDKGLKPRPLDDYSMYYVAMPDYLTDGSTDYCMFDHHDPKLNITSLNNYLLDIDIMLDYLKALSPVQPEEEGRVVFVDEPTEGSRRSTAKRFAVYRIVIVNLVIVVIIQRYE